MVPNFDYIRPHSLKDAVKELAGEEIRLHAGGTDLLGCLRDNVFGAKKVVSIGGLKELRGIRETKDGTGIGALTTITEVAGSKVIRERYKALAQGASEVASPQLRNQGTIGGNLCQKPRCWYYRGEFHCLRKGGDICYAVAGENQFHCIFGGDGCYIVHPSDTAPALVALGAEVRVVGGKGAKVIPLENFFILPSEDPMRETVLVKDEIVTEIILPPPATGLRSSYRKVRARRSWDFALAGVALAIQFGEDRQVRSARVVLSGAAPIPWRSGEVEQAITGKRLDEATIAEASRAVVRNAQPMEQNGYKIPLFQAVMTEELRAISKA